MYINKNKGITIIEALVSFFIMIIFFQGMYIFSKNLTKNKNIKYREMYIKNKMDIYMYKLQKRVRESYKYRILNIKESDYFIELKDEDVGNSLVIESYNVEKFPEKEFLEVIYVFQREKLIIYQGKKSNFKVYIDKNNSEILEENINGKFEKTPFGIKIKCKKNKIEVIYEIFK